jgi:hypothetical protein
MESSNIVLEFSDQESKESAEALVRRVPRTILIQNFFGRTMQVTMFHSAAGDPEPSLRAQGVRAEVLTRWTVKLPKSEHHPREIDWRIIGLMLRNAETRFPDIAASVKASTRTVRRRVGSMMSSSAFFMQPLLDLRKALGVTPCQLLVKCSPPSKRALDEAIASRFKRMVFKLTNSETHSAFTILCSNAGEVKEIHRWAKSQPGVEFAKTDILEQQDYVHDWLEREVKNRIREPRVESSMEASIKQANRVSNAGL